MGSQEGRMPGKPGRRTGAAKRAGSVTDALREEAERGWAAEDRKSAKALRRGAAQRRKRPGGSATARSKPQSDDR
jgi:hypothetical protein